MLWICDFVLILSLLCLIVVFVLFVDTFVLFVDMCTKINAVVRHPVALH